MLKYWHRLNFKLIRAVNLKNNNEPSSILNAIKKQKEMKKSKASATDLQQSKMPTTYA